MFEEITTTQLANILNSQKINLIDVSDNYEYDSFHINGAINIPKDHLIHSYVKYLNLNDLYYIICKSGMTSRSVCMFLSLKGYKVINVLGGTNSWPYRII